MLLMIVGINSGSVIGGVYGNRIPQFDILGDTVTSACQIAAASPVSTAT